MNVLDVPRLRASEPLTMERKCALEQICQHLDLDAIEVYALMTTRGFPSVEGTWIYNRMAVERWIASLGSVAAVRAAVRAHLALQCG